MSHASKSTNDIANAIRLVRKYKGLSQEAFGSVSSRTYLSSLERNRQSPTLNKIDLLADVMGVHPLTLLVLSYLGKRDAVAVDKVLGRVAAEIAEIE